MTADTAAEFWADRRARHPRFAHAVAADTRMAAAYRGERFEFRGPVDQFLQILRLCLVSDAFLGQVLYRAKAACVRRRIPLIPHLLNRLVAITTQMYIDDVIIVASGVHIPHGHVVLGGITEIQQGVLIAPFVSIGLRAGELRGPVVGRGSKIGTGSRVLGPIELGPGVVVGANAVVMIDVPAGATAVGVPARVIPAKDESNS